MGVAPWWRHQSPLPFESNFFFVVATRGSEFTPGNGGFGLVKMARLSSQGKGGAGFPPYPIGAKPFFPLLGVGGGGGRYASAWLLTNRGRDFATLGI